MKTTKERIRDRSLAILRTKNGPQPARGKVGQPSYDSCKATSTQFATIPIRLDCWRDGKIVRVHVLMDQQSIRSVERSATQMIRDNRFDSVDIVYRQAGMKGIGRKVIIPFKKKV